MYWICKFFYAFYLQPAEICENSGEMVMSNLNFDSDNMYFNLWMMAFYIVCVYTIGYIGLVIRVQLAR